MSGAIALAGAVHPSLSPRVDYAVKVFHGEQIKPLIPQFILLHLKVCGDNAEYQPFLEIYAQNNGIACASFDQGRLIGAAIGVPLQCMPERFRQPFVGQLERMYYLGSGVVDQDHRGKSLGERLFEAFEQEVPRQFDIICYCELIRPAPTLEPVNGFLEQRDKTFQGIWKDVGSEKEIPRTMVYWTKQR